MANEVRVTWVALHAEIEPPDDATVEMFGAYVEMAAPATTFVTASAAYVEMVGDGRPYVTAAGAYIEMAEAAGSEERTVTTVAAYVEELETPTTEGDVRVTAFGVHMQHEGAADEAEVTALGVYSELEGVEDRTEVTAIGAYSELEGVEDRAEVTAFGVYIEFEYQEEIVPTYYPSPSGSRRPHMRLPDEVVGYAFDPDYSWWAVVAPEASENLLRNPSFEEVAYTEHYTASLWSSITQTTSSPVGATGGRTCMQMVVNPLGANAVLVSHSVSVSSGQRYTWSLDLYCTRPGFKVELDIRLDTQIQVRRVITMPGPGWQRYELSHTFLATGSADLQLVSPATNTGAGTFFTDRWQFEQKAQATLPFDGDSIGLLDVTPNQSFYWTGAPYQSTSVRRATTGASGVLIPFSDEVGFLTTGIIGLGMAPVEHELTRLTNGQEVLRDIRELPRDFTLTGRIFGCDYSDLARRRRALIDLVRPNKTPRREPLILRHQPTTNEGELIGFPLEIICAYKEGLQGNITNLYQETFGIQFHAPEPLLAETIDASVNLDLYKSLQPNLTLFRDADGEYFNMGAGATTEEIKAVGFLATGGVLVGGNFTQVGGAVASRLASWSPSTGWAAAFALNGEVLAIDGGSDYGYQAIIGGEFTNYFDGELTNPLGHVARMDEFGFFLPLDNGVNETVRVVRRAVDGDVYVGGDFTANEDNTNTDLSRIARWNADDDAWEALGEGLADGAVSDILVADNGYVYVAGFFTGAVNTGGATDADCNNICRFNLATGLWEDMDRGVNNTAFRVLYGPDRAIYIAGQFTEAVAGTVLPGFARWSGTIWEPVGVTLSQTPRNVWLDEEGIFWFAPPIDNTPFVIPEYGSVGFFGWRNGVYYPPFLHKTGITGGGAVYHSEVGAGGREAVFVIQGESNAQGSEYLVPALNRITVGGDGDARPTLHLAGTQRPVSLRAESALAQVHFRNTLVVPAGETARLVTSSTRNLFFSNSRPNLMRHISLPASDLASVRLLPGENLISLYALDTDEDAEGWLTWRNRWYSIDAAVSE